MSFNTYSEFSRFSYKISDHVAQTSVKKQSATDLSDIDVNELLSSACYIAKSIHLSSIPEVINESFTIIVSAATVYISHIKLMNLALSEKEATM